MATPTRVHTYVEKICYNPKPVTAGMALTTASKAYSQHPLAISCLVMCVLMCVQNFFRSYKKLAGMTGTAATEASEFDNIYKLPVTVVPTNQKVCRTDESDVVFSKEEGVNH